MQQFRRINFSENQIRSALEAEFTGVRLKTSQKELCPDSGLFQCLKGPVPFSVHWIGISTTFPESIVAKFTAPFMNSHPVASGSPIFINKKLLFDVHSLSPQAKLHLLSEQLSPRCYCFNLGSSEAMHLDIVTWRVAPFICTNKC